MSRPSGPRAGCSGCRIWERSWVCEPDVSVFRDGLTIAARQKGVVALLWAATVLFAALTAWPAWSWWDRATYLPASDGLLERFSLGVFGELMQDGGSSAFGVLLATASSVLFVVALGNALLS